MSADIESYYQDPKGSRADKESTNDEGSIFKQQPIRSIEIKHQYRARGMCFYSQQ